MFSRPKPGENEEDILRLQEEFMREKQKNESLQPAAQVVNLRRTEHQATKRSSTNESGTRKPSKYAQSKGLSQEKRLRNEPSTSVMGDILEKNIDTGPESPDEDDKVYFPKIKPALLGEIVEKNLDNFDDLTMHPMPSKGFPAVTLRDPNKMPGKSICATEMEDKQNQETGETEPMQMDVDNTAENSNSSDPMMHENTDPLNLPPKSYILSNKDANDIHSDNVKVLSQMSEKEILEEQQKLLSSLDPKLVEFLKARRQENDAKKKTEDVLPKNEKEEAMETEDLPAATAVDADSDTLWDNDVLSHPEVNKWLHFDSLEKDKLEWMKGIEESKTANPDEPYEARFDFNGYLLPYTMEYTEATKTLFHHGDEPHRPGYSIKELIELSRSTVTQQRVMALNTIAGLLEYYSAGTYKNVIEIPLSKLFFVLRYAIDENIVIILEPALRGMRNLLYNRIDEACLDALIGYEEGTLQPSLENDKSEIEEMESTEAELNDFHLAEIDLITAILRTDILQRLYYIIECIKPSFNCVQFCLQILTRLARDSVEIASRIVGTDHLMNAIITNFMPVTGVNFTFNTDLVYNGKPIVAALKLMRILSLQSREIGEILISKYDIVKPVSEYMSSGVDGTYGLRLQMESYCIMTNLLHFDLAIEQVHALIPVIVTSLYKHVHGTDIFMNTTVVSSTHAAVILQLMNKLCNCDRFDAEKYGLQIIPLIEGGLAKWMAQTASIESYTYGHLRAVSSALDCWRTILEKASTSSVLNSINNIVKSLSTSKGFKKIVNNIVPNSNLLSGIQEKDLNVTKNLVTLGGAFIDSDQKVLPVFNVTSPIPFLASLFKVLVHINDKEIALRYIELMEPYLLKFVNKTPSLMINWFTRMEIELIFSILRLSLQCNDTVTLKDIIYSTASKLCYILRGDKQFELHFLFDNIIFNRQWFAAERSFKLMSCSQVNGFLYAVIAIEEIKQVYSTVFNSNYTKTSPNILYKKWQHPILPRDWIYLPLMYLYSNTQVETQIPAATREVARKLAADKEHIIKCTLQWIVFNGLFFPDLWDDISATDKFCWIACVFLCDDSLFLDEQIFMLLRKCTRVLFKKSSEFDFGQQLNGLDNFEDFYTQLLEQFQSVSYGDINFASCVLAPLAQHHDVKWRKKLWSEYAGCLWALDCPKPFLPYDLSKYMYPEETDESLIQCYFSALSFNILRPGTVVHKIALHHTECFRRRRSLNSNSSNR